MVTSIDGIDFAQINYDAFTEDVAVEQVLEHKRVLREKITFSPSPWMSNGRAVGIAGIVIFAITGFFVFLIVQFVASLFAASYNVFWASYILPIVLVAAIVFFALRTMLMRSRKWKNWYRLDQFARRNDFAFIPETAAANYPGLIFNRGNDRKRLDNLRPRSGRFFDIGNYRFTTGAGKESTTHRCGYLAMKLDRRLPNMVLDAKANNGVFGGTNLPIQFMRDQVLRLEGDFNRYFTLYAPREYERDALYIFTPDLMALLIDRASSYDVEIVDDWLFVYSSTPLPTADASTWRRLFHIMQTVGAKTLTQTENYRDDRMLPTAAAPAHSFADTGNRVAPEGQRLRRGVSWGSIAVVVVIALFWAYQMFLR